MYRVGKSLVELEYYSKAREWFTKALELCKDKDVVSLELEKIQDKASYFIV